MSSFHPESVYIFIKARRLCRSSVIDIYDIVINVNDKPIRCLCDNEGKNKRPSSRHLILLRRAQLFFLLKNLSGTTNIRAPSCFHFLSLINSIQDNGSTQREKKSNRVEGRTNFSTLFFFSFPFLFFFFFFVFTLKSDFRACSLWYILRGSRGRSRWVNMSRRGWHGGPGGSGRRSGNGNSPCIERGCRCSPRVSPWWATHNF